MSLKFFFNPNDSVVLRKGTDICSVKVPFREAPAPPAPPPKYRPAALKRGRAPAAPAALTALPQPAHPIATAGRAKEEDGRRTGPSQLLGKSRAKYETLHTGHQIKTLISARSQVMPAHSHAPCRARRRALPAQLLPQPLRGTVSPFQCSIFWGRDLDRTAVRCEPETTALDSFRDEIHAKGTLCNSSGCFSVPAAVMLCDLRQDDICCSGVTSSSDQFSCRKRGSRNQRRWEESV